MCYQVTAAIDENIIGNDSLDQRVVRSKHSLFWQLTADRKDLV